MTLSPTLAAIQDELDALVAPPGTPLDAPASFYRLGPSAKLHFRRTCGALSRQQRHRLAEVSTTYRDAPAERCCQMCAYARPREVHRWETRLRKTSELRELTAAALPLLTAPAEHIPALTGLTARLDAVLAEALTHDLDADLEIERDFLVHLERLTSLARSVRSQLTPLLAHLDTQLSTKLRADAVAGVLRRQQSSHYTLSLPRHVPGAEVLCAERSRDHRGRTYPSIESTVLEEALSFLVAGGSEDELEAHLRLFIDDEVGDEPLELVQLPASSDLPLAEFLSEGRLDLEGYTRAAWQHEAARARVTLLREVIDQLRTRMRRVASPAAAQIIAVSEYASTRSDGVDLDEVFTRFPAVAQAEGASFHVVPGLVASWARAVLDEDELVVLGPLLSGEGPELLTTAAALVSEDDSLADGTIEALALARAALS